MQVCQKIGSSRVIRHLWHLSAFIWIFTVALYVFYHHEGPPYRGKLGPWKFLTHLNMIAQLIYFFVALLCDLLVEDPDFDKSKGLLRDSDRTFLHRLRDLLFTVPTFPMAVFVATLFWGIYAMDPNLIRVQQAFYYPILNQMQHTVVAFTVLIECLLVRHNFEKKWKRDSILVLVFVFGYLTWAFIVKDIEGLYPYPFMEKFNQTTWILFVVVMILFAYLVVGLCRLINYLRWGSLTAGYSESDDVASSLNVSKKKAAKTE